MNHEMYNVPLSSSVLWNVPGINYFLSIRESQQERVYRSQTFSGYRIATQATCKTVAYTSAFLLSDWQFLWYGMDCTHVHVVNRHKKILNTAHEHKPFSSQVI